MKKYVATMKITGSDRKATEVTMKFEFQKQDEPYYGNGYHMKMQELGCDANYYDIRYDSRLAELGFKGFIKEFIKSYVRKELKVSHINIKVDK